MDRREHLYSGDRELRALTKGDEGQKAPHIRNIVFENIESQVSSAIPSPKVTPRRKEDEGLADKIEHWLRCELDRLPFETINDQAERTVPIQGGVGFLVAWDNRKRTHDTVGEEEVAMLHPKQFAPQPGIYTGIQDMDWFIVRQAATKESIRRRYGVNVENEGEQEPQVRGTGDEDTADDAVTMYIGYAKNDQGGIDRYVWVNDIELEDLENYQARRVPVCAHCGRVRPLPGQIIQNRQAVADDSGDRGSRSRAGPWPCSWRRRWRPVSAEAWKPWRRRWQQSRRRLRQNGTTADHAHGAGARTGPPKSRSTKK